MGAVPKEQAAGLARLLCSQPASSLCPIPSWLSCPRHAHPGNGTWTYSVTVRGYFALGTVTIRVTKPAPVAVADQYTCPAAALCVVSAAAGLLANDYTNNTSGSLAVIPARTLQPAGSNLTLQTDGSFQFLPGP